MSLIVQKFGGSSVADRDRIFNVAGIATRTFSDGNDVIVIVSAQGDTTDELLAKYGYTPKVFVRQTTQSTARIVRKK